MFLKSLAFVACLLVHEGCSTVSTNPADVVFYLHSDQNTKHELVLGDKSSFQSGLIRSQAQTYVIIDGFLSDGTSPMSTQTKNELLRSNPESNVIVLDWGALSGSGVTIEGQLQLYSIYLKVLGNLGPVAERAADFLHFLNTETGVEFSQVHIIGHSMGAHIAGATGYWTKQKYQTTIARISGLDPAGPFFSGQNNADKRLEKGDALFVDIYHTNRGTLGDSAHQTGDINVYVNGGASQPGCEEADKAGFQGYCSHSFSWQLWNACSESNSCYACPCAGYDCQCAACEPTCSNGIILGLNLDTTTANAAYYIRTGPLDA